MNARVAWALPLLALHLTAATAAKPDFSGVWLLDLAKSKLEIAKPISGVFYITNKDPMFRLKRTLDYPDESDTWNIELTAGGAPVILPDNDYRATLNWQDDRHLLFKSSWTEKGGHASSVVLYSLAPGEKTLTIDEQTNAPSGKRHNIWVLNRRP